MILFQTEANTHVGFGHVNRCILLASLLKKHHAVHFLVNKDKTLAKILKERKIEYSFHEKRTESWNTGVSAIIIDTIEPEKTDPKLVAHAQHSHIPVVVLSKNPMKTFSNGYAIVLEPRMMILHQKFRHFRRINRKYAMNIHRAFISLGGRSTYRHMRKTIDSVIRCVPNIKIAMGPFLKKSSKKTLKRIYPTLRFVGETDNLARSLYESDLAILAPGMVAYEAAAVGTPALYVYQTPESGGIADFFEQKGAGVKISQVQHINHRFIRNTINSMSIQKRESMGNAGKALVDGKGIFRVIDFLKNEDII